MSVKISVLQSSSSGNSTLITYRDKHILVDTGPDYDYLENCFETLRVKPQDIQGVFLTHSHGDHFNRATLMLCLKYGIPFYHCFSKAASKESLARYKTAYTELKWARELQHVIDGKQTTIGDFSISSFKVPHDSLEGCWGFRIAVKTEKGDHFISYCTDIASFPDELVNDFKNSHAIIMECNHDVQMLKTCGRPHWLVNRIIKEGHLSNEQCASALVSILKASKFLPSCIILAHISREANKLDVAENVVNAELYKAGFKNVSVVVALPDKIVGVSL